MRAIKAALLAAALCVAAGPAFAAWGTLTKLNSSNNWNHVSSGHTATLTTNTIVPSGAIIVLAAGARALSAASDAMPFADSAGDTFTSIKCANTTTTNDATAIGYAISSAGLASGGTVSVSDTSTPGTNATSLQIVGGYITGGAASSPEDVAVEACNSGIATTSPTVTSGAASVAGDLFVSMYADTIVGTFSFTEDASWTALTAASDSNMGVGSASRINAGTSALTRTVTSNNEPYTMSVIGLKVAGAVASPQKQIMQSVP